MKKFIFLATVFVAGAATAAFAQLSAEKNDTAAYGRTVINYQDTTKPVKDTVPPKKDSTAFRF